MGTFLVEGRDGVQALNKKIEAEGETQVNDAANHTIIPRGA